MRNKYFYCFFKQLDKLLASEKTKENHPPPTPPPTPPVVPYWGNHSAWWDRGPPFPTPYGCSWPPYMSGVQSGYVNAPNYGPPSGYGHAPNCGPPSGYGHAPNYGPPSGYGNAPNYGPANYSRGLYTTDDSPAWPNWMYPAFPPSRRPT